MQPISAQVSVMDAAQASREIVRTRGIARWDGAGWMRFLHTPLTADDAAAQLATVALTVDVVSWVRHRVMHMLHGAWA